MERKRWCIPHNTSMWLWLILQVVDGNWGVHAIVPKQVFGLGDLATKEEEEEAPPGASAEPSPSVIASSESP
jgi:hypothetical protein